MVKRWRIGVISAAFCVVVLPAMSQAPFGGQPEPWQGARPGPPDMPGAFRPMPEGPPIPGLARRMGTIMALRHIVGMGYTRYDIGTALPVLRQMRDAEKALQARAEQIMAEETKALLGAVPGNPPMTDPGARLGESVGRFAQEQGNRWWALAQAIGPEKMQGLRVLVSPEPQPVGPPGMPGAEQPNLFGPPEALQPGGLGPQNPFGALPPGADQPGLPPQPGQFSQPGFAPQPVPGRQPGLAQEPGPGIPPAGASRGPRPRAGVAGRPRAGLSPGAMRQPGRPGMGPMPMTTMGMGPHLTLAELVDLLEQRLAAMKG